MTEKDKFLFPQIMRNAVHGLNHSYRWEIIELLAKKGELDFMQLKRLLKTDANILHFHLKVLLDTGIVMQFMYFKPRRYVYRISSFGEDTLTGLWSALVPMPKPKKTKQSRKI